MRSGTRRVVAAACGALLLALAGCGKKAPLRLPDSRPAEQAPALRARVREGRVTLEFAVPAHRVFPEREEPWVLARILRQPAGGATREEVGAILEPAGFAFDAPLAWTEEYRPPGAAVGYQVEFRDAARRRRAETGTVSVGWDAVPEAPAGLTAVGGERAVALTWVASPAGAAGYRPYRRLAEQAQESAASADPVATAAFVDTRIDPGREYCYRLRAVLVVQGIEIEGPASAEVCARTEGPPDPPRTPPEAR